MASALHGSAGTTPCHRAEFQLSQESTRALAARYGLNPKTVAKWRKRTTTVDAPIGAKSPKSTVLTPACSGIGKVLRLHPNAFGYEPTPSAPTRSHEKMARDTFRMGPPSRPQLEMDLPMVLPSAMAGQRSGVGLDERHARRDELPIGRGRRNLDALDRDRD
jgi:hypothetical protein